MAKKKSCLLQTDLQQEDMEDKKLLHFIYYLFNNKNLKKMLKIYRVRNELSEFQKLHLIKMFVNYQFM